MRVQGLEITARSDFPKKRNPPFSALPRFAVDVSKHATLRHGFKCRCLLEDGTNLTQGLVLCFPLQFDLEDRLQNFKPLNLEP